MTAYVAVPNGDIDQDSPVSQPLMQALRDNPLAMFEGAVGAPRLMDAALDTSAPSAAGAGWVAARQALVTAGAVGTYALLLKTSTTLATFVPGDTASASAFNYASAGADSVSTPSPAGTWRCMGFCRTDTTANIPATSDRRTTLWLRIL